MKDNLVDSNKKQTGYPTKDMPWLKYYETNNQDIQLPKKSIYQFARDRNENNKNQIAIDLRVSTNDFKRGIKITYADFFKTIDKMAKSSKALGVKNDEIMPLILPNVPEARTFIYSNSKIGAVSYPISPLLPNNTLERIVKENNIKTIVVFNDLYEKYANALKNCNLNSIVYLDGTESIPTYIKKLKMIKNKLQHLDGKKIPIGDNIISWDEYYKLNKEVKTNITPYYADNHTAVIIGTSGTTGSSKGVCLTDDNINAAAIEYIDGKFFNGTFLDALLPSIGYGISMLHYQVSNGHYTYLIPELVTDKISTLIQATKPDNFPGGPVHYANLLNSDEYKNRTLYCGQNYISGGASLPKEIEKKLNCVDENYKEVGYNKGIFVRQGFGLSENVATGSYSKKGTYKFGSIGIPLPYSCVSIFKPGTDEELGYNESGEICITGPTVMKEYLNNDSETNKVILIHSDGKRWIHTKDIGKMDEDGNLFHLERIKNIFMRTGFNVHPTKISEFLNTIDGVANSYVSGFEHPTQQCVPVAFIILEKEFEGKEETVKERISKECYNNLEETSVPYEYIFLKDFPINVGGKIDGIKIKENSGINYMNNPKVLKKI